MKPCWAAPPRDSSSVTPSTPESPRQYQAAVATEADVCDYCASPRLVWRKCKLICEQCSQINKSCADL